MKFDIVTIFPRMFDGPTREGILGRARFEMDRAITALNKEL